MLAHNWLGSYPVYRYDTAMWSTSARMDDFGTLIPMTMLGYNTIFNGTYNVWY